MFENNSTIRWNGESSFSMDFSNNMDASHPRKKWGASPPPSASPPHYLHPWHEAAILCTLYLLQFIRQSNVAILWTVESRTITTRCCTVTDRRSRIVICRRNRVPWSGSEIHYPVPNPDKGAITGKIKDATKHETSPARLAQLLHNCCSPH